MVFNGWRSMVRVYFGVTRPGKAQLKKNTVFLTKIMCKFGEIPNLVRIIIMSRTIKMY